MSGKICKLFKYTFHSHCQGSRDRGVEYALLHVHEDASFNNNRSHLILQRHEDYNHEIDIESVEDLTIIT